MSIVRMAIMDRNAMVHDLDRGDCNTVRQTRGEFSLGGPRYIQVNAKQVKVFKLPGCPRCFGTEAAFRNHINNHSWT